jgi:hypothetical protein
MARVWITTSSIPGIIRELDGEIIRGAPLDRSQAALL